MSVSREKTKAEFKKNLIAVFTLGLSAVPKSAWGATYDSAKDSTRGTSFEQHSVTNTVFKCLWFLFFGAILMAIYFIKNLFMALVNGIGLLFIKSDN